MTHEHYNSADLCAALGHARSFGAFQWQAIERILQVKGTPRSLAEYVTEQTARDLDEVPKAPDSFVRDLDEYDRLPLFPRKQETP